MGRPRLSVLTLQSSWASGHPPGGQTIDKAVLDRAKDATVYIKLKASGRIEARLGAS